MCEVALSNLANAINAELDPTKDFVPSLVFFRNSQCAGGFFPNQGGAFTTNTWKAGETLNASQWNNQAAALFIPFNFKTVLLTSNAGRTSTLLGPYLIPDLSTVTWQNNLAGQVDDNMQNDPIKSVLLVTVATWESESVYSMCMGKIGFIGNFALDRYKPQSTRCDAYMQTNWCVSHPDNEECGCFKDLVSIQAKSQDLKVNLPVLCFGQTCALKNTYKTNNILSQPCSITICQQTINSTPGIINAGEDTIFCAGQFFNEQGILPAPVNILPANPSDTGVTNTGTPFYVWIMVGVSGILFVLLVFLLFGSRPKPNNSSVLAELRRLEKPLATSTST